MPIRDSSSSGAYGEAWRPEAEGKRLALERIEEAARCIDPVFLGSPQYEAEALGDELGLRVVCKVETENPIRSFKGRGTDYLLYRLGGEEGRPDRLRLPLQRRLPGARQLPQDAPRALLAG